MKGRIRITFPVHDVPHSFTKLFTAPDYLSLIVKGRERVAHNTTGVRDFKYEIEYQTRRLEWALVEIGTSQERWLKGVDHSQCQKSGFSCPVPEPQPNVST